MDEKALKGRRCRKVPEVSSALDTDTDTKYTSNIDSAPGTGTGDVPDFDPAPASNLDYRDV